MIKLIFIVEKNVMMIICDNSKKYTGNRMKENLNDLVLMQTEGFKGM